MSEPRASLVTAEPVERAQRVLVVGCGGIGGITAACLSETWSALGVEVVSYSTNVEIAEAIRHHGFRLTGAESTRSVPGQCLSALTPDVAPFDLVILAVQPPNVEQAARSMLPWLKPDGAMVCFQNGLCEDRVAKIAGADRLAVKVATGRLALRNCVEQLGFGRQSASVGEGNGTVIGRVEPEYAHPPACAAGKGQILGRAAETGKQMVIVRVDNRGLARHVGQNGDAFVADFESPRLGVVSVGRKRCIPNEVACLRTLLQCRAGRRYGSIVFLHGAHASERPDSRSSGCQPGTACLENPPVHHDAHPLDVIDTADDDLRAVAHAFGSRSDADDAPSGLFTPASDDWTPHSGLMKDNQVSGAQMPPDCGAKPDAGLRNDGAPGGIRTPDLRSRNPMLYPAELRVPKATQCDQLSVRPKRKLSA